MQPKYNQKYIKRRVTNSKVAVLTTEKERLFKSSKYILPVPPRPFIVCFTSFTIGRSVYSLGFSGIFGRVVMISLEYSTPALLYSFHEHNHTRVAFSHRECLVFLHRHQVSIFMFLASSPCLAKFFPLIAGVPSPRGWRVIQTCFVNKLVAALSPHVLLLFIVFASFLSCALFIR